MMEKEFIAKVLEEAKKAGMEAAEVYMSSADRFKAMCHGGEITGYTVNSGRGFSLRGLVNGKMGYAATEAMDDEAIRMLVDGVLQSAKLCEDEDKQVIFRGSESYETIETYAPALDEVSEERKLQLALDIEKAALNADARIRQVDYNMVNTTSGTVSISNTYGLNLSHRDNIAVAYADAVAAEGEKVSTGSCVRVTRDFDTLNAEEIGREAAAEAVFMLGAEPVESGTYRCIIRNDCFPDLLATFSGIFSAENAQKGLSLLKGREGEKIAADPVTLMDDPLMHDGLSSGPFDAEGVATYTKAVIENGTLRTLLHNLKTAGKAGVKSTGNAAKGNYSSPVQIQPTNFYLVPGTRSLEEMQQEMGEGIVITEVGGLHAGADAVSGDFSLLSKGYTVRNGRKTSPVERITVAGNFYQLLKNIREAGNDLLFPGGHFGSPSVDIGEISIAGK